MKLKHLGWAVLAAGFPILLASCGGAGSSKQATRRGSIALTVRWPESSRLIPAATNSLRFKAIVLDPEEDEVAANRVLARPQGQAQSTLLLDDLPSVRIRMNISAHASSDGTGTALATGSMDIAVLQDSTVSQTITLSTRVTEVRVSPTSGSIAIGQAQRFTASAFDADGSLVVIRPDKWKWSSIVPAVGAVAPLNAPDGDKADVSGVSSGSTTITVTETESGVFRAFTVTVAAPITITISPANASVDCGSTQSFSASVPGVTWNASGGVISASGVFTAGDIPGQFEISASAPGGSASVPVTIKCPAVFGSWSGQLEASSLGLDVQASDGNTIRGAWFVNVSQSNNTASVVAIAEHGVLIGPSPLQGYDLPRIDTVFQLTGSPQHMTGTSSSGATIDIQAFSLPAGSSGGEFLKLRINGLPGLALYIKNLTVDKCRILFTDVAPSSTWVSDNRERTALGCGGGSITRSFLTRTGNLPPSDFHP